MMLNYNQNGVNFFQIKQILDLGQRYVTLYLQSYFILVLDTDMK